MRISSRHVVACIALALCIAALGTSGQSSAGPPAGEVARQDMESLLALARAHLQAASEAAHPGVSARVETGPIDPRLRLPHCPAPDFQLAPGSRAQGAGSLAIRCRAPDPWTFYLSFDIRLSGDVLVATRPLPARSAPRAGDVELQRMQLVLAPGQYFRHAEQLQGSVLIRPIAAGQPIVLDALSRRFAVRANQRVRLVAGGPGFQVAQEGVAQNAAYIGDTVSVKMPSGRILRGVAEADGSVRVP